MRTKLSLFNIISLSAYYFINVFFGLVNRKVFLMCLGVEYQGISGLFTNILAILSVAELGIGTAIVYHLYEPIANNSIEKIKSLIHLYKKCYQVITTIIGIIGIIFIPFLSFFIGKNSINININIIYLLSLLDVLVSYIFMYKRSMLYADQKNYLVTTFDIGYIISVYTIQIIVLYITKSYYLYLVIKVAFRIIENLALNIIVMRLYPYLKDKSIKKLDKSIIDDVILKVKGLLFHKVGNYIVNGTDNILISKFVSVVAVGLYSNYNLIISSVTNAFGQAVAGTTASVGNLLVEGDKSKKIEIFNELQIFNAAIINFAASAMFCMSTPFVDFFFGVEYSMEVNVIFVLMIKYITTEMKRVYGVFKDAAGIQYEDRYVPVIESFANLILSLLFVFKFGIVGVFLGTVLSNIIAYLYTYPILVWKGVLGATIESYFKQLIRYISVIIFDLGICYGITKVLSTSNYFVNFAMSGVIALIVPNIIFYLNFKNRKEFSFVISRLASLLSKFNFLKKKNICY